MSERAHKSASQLSDSELVAQIADAQLEALGALFERHESLVRRYLGRLGVSASDADDLVQATFLEVMRAAQRFDPSYAVRSWLLGIASMMVRRQRRSLRRAAARIAAWTMLARAENPGGRGPVELVEGEATLQTLARALDALAPKKREAFVLVTFEGLSGEEAALALGIPVKTVWTRLHHARRELRACLPKEKP